MVHMTLYTTTSCMLCEDAKRMIALAREDFEFTWNEVNIESDDALHEKYCLQVPVLEKDGEVVAFGQITLVDLVDLVE